MTYLTDRSKETIDFSRMESQFQPKQIATLDRKRPSASAAWSFNFGLTTRALPWFEETTNFSRMESQFQPIRTETR